MAKKKPEGVCRICGCYGPLTFEYVPPRKAFNNRPVIGLPFEEMISLGPDDRPTGDIHQAGMGWYTLCAKCNNNTGNWYAKDFIDWCYQGMEMLDRTNGNPDSIYLNNIYPLRVLKQIVTMFFSVNHEGFHKPNQELVQFVLNREMNNISPKYRFFVYYNIAGALRSSGIVAAMNLNVSSKPMLMSAITFP